MTHFSLTLKTLLALLMAASMVHSAQADDHGDSWWSWGKKSHSEYKASGHSDRNGDSRAGMASTPPKYREECAACHVAYPAGFLPAGSWQRMMSHLNKHYGTDASLDDVSLREITAYLTSQSGTYKRVSEMPVDDRITSTYWFQRKHGEKHVPAGTWSRPSIGSPSKCEACHQNAPQGVFDEHDVRIPR
ncbi:diheme cytochrome c [Rhodoferax sp.]|uniref:diheme cytochrome c n=1 Tax=Rhodoferax sp. TaxID=50421 RepID=UPI00262BBC77|nr:diheme cytochrome c [Rhodoferax sp.]MDD2923929.1 diheme cytochrome c [Rhodoferax sp.]